MDGFAHPEYLVTAAWLADHLADPDVVALDSTVYAVDGKMVAARSDFEAGHVPGAQFVDLGAELSDPTAAAHLEYMLPPVAQFTEVMGRLGVGDRTRVICYATGNHWWATRVWWMLRAFGHENVAVLDGGFQRWKAEGRPVETGPGRARPAARPRFTFQPEMVASKDEVRAAIGAGDVCTANALRPELHTAADPTSYPRSGHITGSVNLPALHVVDADNRFKSADELRRMFAPALAKPRVIAYCGGGISATSPTFVLTLLGHPDVRVYDGSLAEWTQDPSLPMSV